MTDIVLFGAGDIADVATVYIERDSELNIVAYTVDDAFRHGDRFQGKPLVSWEALKEQYPPDRYQLLGPLSYRRMNQFRRDRYLEGLDRGYRFASFIHPSCHIYSDQIGSNCFMLEANVVQPFVTIGDNVMLWSGNHIGHHSTLGNHVFVGAQVGISGGATIGDESFIGGKTGIGSGCQVGKAAFIAEGCAINSNVADHAVYLKPGTKPTKHHSSRIARLM